MAEASTKLQRIKERIAELSKINATEVFTHEQLEKRKQTFNRKSIVNYQIPQIEDAPMRPHFEKNQNNLQRSSKPIFVLNTDFFRRHLLEGNETNMIPQQDSEQQQQNQQQNKQIFIQQNDKKQVQPHSSKVEPPFNFIKLNPVQNQQQPLPEQQKPVSVNSMATNIFNMTQPIANLFNNSSTSTQQSILKLRNSFSNSSVPVLFTNTNLLFNNTNGKKIQMISEEVNKQKDSSPKLAIDQINNSQSKQKEQMQFEQLKSSQKASQIKKGVILENVSGQKKKDDKQQPKLTHSQKAKPFIQLSYNQVNTSQPDSDSNKKILSNNLCLFTKETESNQALKLKGSLCEVNLDLFNNNTTSLKINQSPKFRLTAVPVQSPPSAKQKPTIETSLFGQSNTLKKPLFDFATKPSVDSVFKTSMNPSKSIFDNSSSIMDNINVREDNKLSKQSQSGEQSSKLICDRPFDNIRLYTKPPSPTIDVLSESISKQIHESIKQELDMPSNKGQLINKSEIEQKKQSLFLENTHPQNNQNYSIPLLTTIRPSQAFKKQSNLTAIGPGGKRVDVPSTPSFFSIQQKPNLFGQQPSGTSLFNTSPKKTPNFFTNSQPTQGGLFSSSGSSLFGKQQLFPSLNPQNSNVGLFGSTEVSIFNMNNKQAIHEGEGHQEEEEEEQDGPIIAEDNANPQLSTGSYDYIQTEVTFKEVANKFRLGTKDIIENVVVSLQKFTDKLDKYIYVRMSNKCIAFTGKIVPKITQIRCLNNSSKNIEIKKILLIEENISKPQLVLLKIQFKDEAKGDKLIKQVSKVLNNEGS